MLQHDILSAIAWSFICLHGSCLVFHRLFMAEVELHTGLHRSHFPRLYLYVCVWSAASKYCPLLIKEGGVSLLEKVLELESSQPDTKGMAG